MPYHYAVSGGILEQVDTTARCSFCDQEKPARYLRAAGHHTCEDCQLADWPQVVERVCEGSRESDPLKIVNLIMKHPMSVMQSPQHHIMAAKAQGNDEEILAAFRTFRDAKLQTIPELLSNV